MPYMHFGSVNWPHWYNCRRTVEQQMVAEGWSKHARKFNDVCKRRTVRLYQGR